MQKQFNSRTCFLCGVDNEQGFKLSWYSDFKKNLVQTEVRIPDYYSGYPGVAHGGIVSALLDETSFRAILLSNRNMLPEHAYLTAGLSVSYLRPTPTGLPLTVLGWINDSSGDKFNVGAEIRTADGLVTARCKAVVVKAPDEFTSSYSMQDEIIFVDRDD